MLPFAVHTIILFGYIFVIIAVGTLILQKLPFPQFVSLLETIFGFAQVRSTGDKSVVINVCGDEFGLRNKFSSRLPFMLAVGASLLISIIVFVDGCIFSTRHIYNKKECVVRTPNCYIFQSNVSKFQPVYEFVCESGQPVIPSNMSNAFAVCYSFVLLDQTTIDVLNQMGVCQGLLWLIEYFYPLCYRFSRYKGGRICIILLLLISVVLESILIAAELNVSLMTIVLLALLIVILGNILFLYYRGLKGTLNLSLIGEYYDLENGNC